MSMQFVKREHPREEKWKLLDHRPFDFVELPDGSEPVITLSLLPTDDEEQRKWLFMPLGTLQVSKI